MLEKISNVSKFLNYAGAAVLLVLMLLTTADVAGRYLFNAPITGVFEVTEFSMACLVFFSLAHTQSRKGHVAVDIFVSLLPPKGQRIIDIITKVLSFIVLLLITWQSIERGFELKEFKETSATLQIPVYPFLFLVAFGCLILSLEFLTDSIKAIKEKSVS